MRSALRKYLFEEKGTAMVLFALALSVMVGFSALVTDLGTVYLHRTRLSNTIDSAVLAGAQELPSNRQAALDVAEQYAEANGLQEGEFSFTVSEDSRTIHGNAEREVGMFFSRALGVESKNVGAHAGARVAPITGLKGIVPFGVADGEYEYGQEVILKQGGGNGDHGSFGALELGGNGSNKYRDNIKYGYDGIIKIGDVFSVEPGNMSGPTSQGIAYRIDLCHHTPQCSINLHVEGCPRIVFVPLGVFDDGNGRNRNFTVTGFAAFVIDEYVGDGNRNEVKGCFIEYIIPGTCGDEGEDYGLYGIQLQE